MGGGVELRERELGVLPSWLGGGWEGGCTKMGGAGCCGPIWGPGTMTGAKDGERGNSMLGPEE